ncbi:16S rRNA (guanine(527)-N(7))-methyltransferase RsmG [Pseudodesulfovibrio sp. F-1]|uniref:Ribosomal RNA small subunit methyltransferase G n=1 Tax=Pseudodesulfovibrio alkaliphilus TaxID=2661613 RepID=A0A7K1KM85_9BACT|nr:16S rRNA (guanine(527)-N(7))-methyltransferase RsmG [Pseudodesulfovibrio alkaliphilus]MUM77208.1 16S rRNA (guanine(527)-N(7))-methyltransferase RsmG [Pseudodesulfovibrio alkaliphilus]
MTKSVPTPADVAAAARRLGRPVTEAQAASLAQYLGQLVKWNARMNLVGPADWTAIFDTLVVDSLYLADFLNGLQLGDTPLCLDLGAGAGLPGIPLRTIWPRGEYWLVESRDKRATFLRSAVGRLGLAATHVFHGRAEEVLDSLALRGNHATADLIVSRAFMPWRELLPFVRPMLRPWGTVVILANTPPPPEAELPAGWSPAEAASYPAGGKTRYFWPLQRVEPQP